MTSQIVKAQVQSHADRERAKLISLRLASTTYDTCLYSEGGDVTGRAVSSLLEPRRLASSRAFTVARSGKQSARLQ